MTVSNQSYVLFGIDFGLNEEQREFIRLIREDPERYPVVFCKGAAGTGKTFAALAAALSMVRAKGAAKRYKRVIYVREPVEIGHRLGYLKGTAEEKYSPYLGGLLDNYNHLMENVRGDDPKSNHLKAPKKKGNLVKEVDDDIYEGLMIDHLPSDIVALAPEFMRGRSFDNSIIIVDEAQNMNLDELQTMVTRISNTCKMVIIGSPNQIDIPGMSQEKNDFLLSYEILKPTKMVGYVELTKPMRSSFVADFDLRFSEYKAKHPKNKNE